MSKQIRAGLIQLSGVNDPEAALQQSLDQVRAIAAKGAKLIILPELHNSLYFAQTETMQNFDLAVKIPGRETDLYASLAAELDIILVTSLFEKRTAGIYHNTVIVFDTDGSIAGKYRKMHIPDDPGYSEKYYFTPGDLGFKPIDTSIGRLGVLICWDQWFPEAARLMTLQGAQCLIYPTAIGWEPSDTEEEKHRQLDSWITIQRSHAIANNLPVLACNRVGTETAANNQIDFWGNSFICGPQGEVLANANTDPEFILADLDFNKTEAVRRVWPFLRDRRIDAYGDLLSRYTD